LASGQVVVGLPVGQPLLADPLLRLPRPGVSVDGVVLPVLRGTAMSQEAFVLPGTIESVVHVRTNGPLIAAAATLWIEPDDTVVDVTYGRGNFWTVYRPDNLIAHDIAIDGVDCRRLPEVDASVDVLVFDPPYIAQGGRDTSTTPDFIDRYGLREAPRNHAELLELFRDGIVEAARVLRPGGRLLVKCMDYVVGGTYRTVRHDVVACAMASGFQQVDEFVHYSGTGPQPNIAKQRTSRRSHSFLCVFRRRRAE